jgi:hypothetical protein
MAGARRIYIAADKAGNIWANEHHSRKSWAREDARANQDIWPEEGPWRVLTYERVATETPPKRRKRSGARG